MDQESQGNTTNLAIKGIIAIQAMSEISKALKQDSDTVHYAVRLPFLTVFCRSYP